MGKRSSGWKKKVLAKIRSLKAGRFGDARAEGVLDGAWYELLLLTDDRADDRKIIELLGKWRKDNEAFFLSRFEVTFERTLSWYSKHLQDKPDRLLFIIGTDNGYVGHVGLFRFDFALRTCEIDNIVRGESAYPGIMGAAILTMMKWGKETLGLEGYTLKVLGDNERAIRLYKKLGYEETARIPLVLISGKDGPEWTEAPDGGNAGSGRFFSVMTFKGKL